MYSPDSTLELRLPRDLFLFPKQNAGFQIPFFLSTEEEAAKVRPPAVVKTLEERLQEFSEGQREILSSFKKAVRDAPWYSEAEDDDWLLLRYLIARNFDVKKSFVCWKNLFIGAEKKTLTTGICEACLKDPNRHMMQFVGWDLQNRPVCFMAMRWGPDRKEPLKHCVATFNHLVKLMPLGGNSGVCHRF
ncbi:hypothetical protein C3747_71g85 [Trypanosoma cruzi]|uniref:CRAL/TRIO N-terminal domain-containing protein n=1 Tax=Trypanosoma cruzi TaxID=5693 RepID=A0A2V2WPT1_TRYCR|nr:hypothetical protein C3747_71g85 [Trypanosoma cruzi]